ncbi:GntR family transcriptional regulator [Citreimonas sp.]|uniref:GntR family transcriptional regulator n=1 Tax=Citreimonas sp. TaxID=3036715 RepID=UPI004059AC20
MYTISESPTRGRAIESVEDALRAEILSGTIEPGERLGEMALANRFSVSRGPVRAALSNLADAGIVMLVPNSGARVRQITRADAGALYQVREALESAAARHAAERATRQDVSELDALLSEHGRSVAAHPEGAYLQGDSDRDFHLVLVRLSGNPIIRRVLAEQLYPQLALLRTQHRSITGRGLAALDEHKRIAAAIRDGDGEIAEILMRRHIANSWASLSTQLDSHRADVRAQSKA